MGAGEIIDIPYRFLRLAVAFLPFPLSIPPIALPSSTDRAPLMSSLHLLSFTFRLICARLFIRSRSRSTEERPKDPVNGTSRPARPQSFVKRTKTYSGCWTCRHRHVKCDVDRPACHRCVKGGLVCQGYGIRLNVGPSRE